MHLFILLLGPLHAHAVVEDQAGTQAGGKHHDRQEGGTDPHIQGAWHVARILLVLPHPPAGQVDQKDNVVHEGVGDGLLDTRYHVVLLFTVGVLGPGSAILLDHADQLHVAGQDSGHRHEESRAHEEVGQTRDVGKGRRRAEADGQEFRLDDGGGQAVEDVETPCQRVESDRKVDQDNVDRRTVAAS